MKIFQIDAFTSRLFAGNPAAVVPMEVWAPDDKLQSVAAENNLSETAFFVKRAEGSDYHLRWFTPTTEVKLCGHATLASAHVLFEHLGHAGDTITFSTEQSGNLIASRDGDTIVLDFPARPFEPAEITTPLVRALGRQPVEVYTSAGSLLCVFESKKDVHDIEPDYEELAELDALGVMATAPGVSHDFVSRFFAPRAGVNEDPVTGSAHCTLAPYWANKTGKKRLTARQVSKRGGEMVCEVKGDRVRLIGKAVTYLEGTIRI
ncbi:MAG: PhzF family phenazine biosynthesis protein [Phycisphaerales bacterium]|nr:PhzF family phenazine biosynthesis protein [Phycisphaerales bacterium]